MAVCVASPSLENVPSVVTFQGGSAGYAVYDPSEYLQTVNFRVTIPPIGVLCDYYVTLSAGQSGNFNQRKLMQDMQLLNYNVYTSPDKSGILKESPSGPNEAIVGAFPVLLFSSQTNDHSFYWTVDPLQVVSASASGYYEDQTLTLSLYTGLLLGLFPTLEDTKTITFRARAESSVDLSLVESGAPFDIGDTIQVIDFGNLETGEQRGFDVVVRSNDGYRVTMQSENGQRLVHERSPAVPDAIDYSVIFDGAQVDLASGVAVDVASGTGVTPATGTAIPIEFSIGNVSGHESAGTYSDIIIVEVTAN